MEVTIKEAGMFCPNKRCKPYEQGGKGIWSDMGTRRSLAFSKSLAMLQASVC